jgi:hypothetical protein
MTAVIGVCVGLFDEDGRRVADYNAADCGD